MASFHSQPPSPSIRSLEKGLDEWRKIIIQDPKSPEKNSWTEFAGGSCSYSYNLLDINNGYEDYFSCYTDYEDCFPRVNGVRNVFVSMAKTQEGSLELQNLVKYGTPMDRQEVLDGILRGIFEVIIDPYGHCLIHRLLDFCDSKQLETIFFNLISSKELFIYTSQLKYGSSALQHLIKRLKKTGLGQFITFILSMRFVELMTSQYGRYVVQECFYTFKAEENKVLYNCAIQYFKEVATTIYGCSSLNVCLGCIGGGQRLELLENLAEKSEFLANDPYGNQVVQEVLMLKNEEITQKICDRLKRSCMHLALKKSGHHVIEKCIQTSHYGLKSIVECIVSSEQNFSRLACDRFGNYVIQTAIEIAKTDDIGLYQSLLAVLKAQRRTLSHNTFGKRLYRHVEDYDTNAEED
ncbi:unnamed protein product [Cuscuta epithymum]|uniref:PUM-HD domain-containing protein n=1 Tax=Cuscuta epithymum TaxID=186058 RepID=A0AAV0C0E5_9ASTE|nr:unnamed protein product [Cuscuta epithymum]